MFVRDRMNRDPICGKPDMSVVEIQELMKSNQVRHLPIVDETIKLVGLVTESALLRALPSDVKNFSRFEVSYILSKLKTDKIMIKSVFTTDPDIKELVMFIPDLTYIP